MDPKKLLQILSDQGIGLSPTFFHSPKREEIRNFWEEIISLVFGPHFILRDLKQVQNAIDTRYAKLVEGSSVPPLANEFLLDRGTRQFQGWATLRIFECLRHFAEMFGIRPPVSISDVSRPTPERLIQFALAIVKWISFQELTLSDELEEWNNVANKAEEAKIKRAERDDFAEAAKKLRQQVALELPEKKRLEALLEQKGNDLRVLHEEFNRAKANWDDVNERCREVEEQRQRRILKLNRLKLEIKETKKEIVDSPGRIVETVQTLKVRAEAEQELAKRESRMVPLQQQHLRVLKDLDDRYDKIKSSIETRARLIKENQNKILLLEAQDNRIASKSAQSQEYLVTMSKLRSELEATHTLLQATREKRAALEKAVEMKHLERLRAISERDLLSQTIQENRLKLEEHVKRCDVVETHHRDREAIIEFIIQDYEEACKREDGAIQQELEHVIVEMNGESMNKNDFSLHAVVDQLRSDDLAKHYVEQFGLSGQQQKSSVGDPNGTVTEDS